ncbi:MAG: hypothetical protein IKJ29_07660 [Akkermansia sp.]|nr:hypothetical protein [Akkermansia sp.]
MMPLFHPEIWFVMLYCVLMWALFALAFFLADNLWRKKEAMVCGLLNLVLVSVLAMLSNFAAQMLGAGWLMSAGFLVIGILLCSMAVSRVCQMLGWLRTCLAAFYALLAYSACGFILGWVIVALHA